MAQISITLPDLLDVYVREQITTGQYSSPSDYIEYLIQQDRDRRWRSLSAKADATRTERDSQLEELALAGLSSGSSTPMTNEDWEDIRAAVRQNIE